MKGVARFVAAAVVVLACVSTVQAFEMEWVTVGDPGNTPDDQVMDDGTTGYGGVGYVYNIGKYEVTSAQYTEFLNAVAASDPYGLYNVEMGSGMLPSITRSGSEGSYEYSTIPGRETLPLSYLSWYDMLRFANWMHNGQPIGDQNASTTEDGAYDMSLGSSVVRKPGALVFLPTEDEWYKAAYYKAGGANAGYWDYPTETDDPNPPTAEVDPGTDMANGSANYDLAVGDLTGVGLYTFKPSDSAYGTFDQAGNLYEGNEADFYGDGSRRGLRGGSWDSQVDWGLHAENRLFYYFDPSMEEYDIGFRVAAVSEQAAVPTVSEWGLIAMTLLILTTGTLVMGRRKVGSAAG